MATFQRRAVLMDLWMKKDVGTTKLIKYRFHEIAAHVFTAISTNMSAVVHFMQRNDILTLHARRRLETIIKTSC